MYNLGTFSIEEGWMGRKGECNTNRTVKGNRISFFCTIFYQTSYAPVIFCYLTSRFIKKLISSCVVVKLSGYNPLRKALSMWFYEDSSEIIAKIRYKVLWQVKEGVTARRMVAFEVGIIVCTLTEWNVSTCWQSSLQMAASPLCPEV